MMTIRSVLFLLLMLSWIGASGGPSTGSVSCAEATCRVCPLVGYVVEGAVDEPVYCIA
ncbi:MAG: hypothetical protein M3O70_11940 [Actinomycetota bacterium]|nr:hypothetical protein [Actinomycetota bacterium]